MYLKTNEIYHGDSLKLLDQVQPGSIDLIVTDPPFAINFKKNLRIYNRKLENVLDGYFEISQDNYDKFSSEWIGKAKKTLKENGSMYIISGTTNLSSILKALELHKLKMINHIIWHYNFAVYTKKKYSTSHYHILYVAQEPSKVIFNTTSRFQNTKECYKDMQDVWVINREFKKNCIKNATSLPLELPKKIIAYSSNKGDTVLDPFAGSSQVLFAAKNMQRNYLGFEIMKDVYDFSKRRLDNDEYYIKAG